MYVLRDQYEVYCVGVNANRQGGTSIYSQSRPKGNAQINPGPWLTKMQQSSQYQRENDQSEV